MYKKDCFIINRPAPSGWITKFVLSLVIQVCVYECMCDTAADKLNEIVSFFV